MDSMDVAMKRMDGAAYRCAGVLKGLVDMGKLDGAMLRVANEALGDFDLAYLSVRDACMDAGLPVPAAPFPVMS